MFATLWHAHGPSTQTSRWWSNLQPVKRMWLAVRQRSAPPRGPRARGPLGVGMQSRYRRPRWQLLLLLLAAAALFGYDQTLDRTQDVFWPPELDVLGVQTAATTETSSGVEF